MALVTGDPKKEGKEDGFMQPFFINNVTRIKSIYFTVKGKMTTHNVLFISREFVICLTKLVSLLGGGFCLRFGDPDKHNKSPQSGQSNRAAIKSGKQKLHAMFSL